MNDSPPTTGPASDGPLPDDVAVDTDPSTGSGLVNASFAGTGAVLVAAVAGVVAPDDLGEVTAVVSGLLFVVGVAAFLWGYATGVVRSRDERITLGGLFFLAGTAPKVIRFRLRLALLAQTVIAVAAASIRPYTAVAFVVLAPMLGLGLMSVWGAKHGRFHPRDDRRS